MRLKWGTFMGKHFFESVYLEMPISEICVVDEDTGIVYQGDGNGGNYQSLIDCVEELLDS